MDKLDIIRDECAEWTEAFTWKNDNPYCLDESEIFALSIFTYDLLAKGKREDNFYFQLNNMLRKSPQEFNKWRGYLYYLQNALDKFPKDQFFGLVFLHPLLPSMLQKVLQTKMELF